VQDHLTASVEGEQVEFSDEVLQNMTDMAKVKKYYKLNSGTPRGGKSGKGMVGGVGVLDLREGGERKEFEMLILGSIALRGAN
jgi:EKC/KEOPS complex subunit CGI121/TPRKB